MDDATIIASAGSTLDMQEAMQLRVKTREREVGAGDDTAAFGGDTVSISDEARAAQAVQAAEEDGGTEGAATEESVLDAPADAKQRQIKMLQQRIEEIQQQIQELEESDMPDELKQRQIAMLNSQLAQYQEQLLELMKGDEK